MRTSLGCGTINVDFVLRMCIFDAWLCYSNYPYMVNICIHYIYSIQLRVKLRRVWLVHLNWTGGWNRLPERGLQSKYIPNSILVDESTHIDNIPYYFVYSTNSKQNDGGKELNVDQIGYMDASPRKSPCSSSWVWKMNDKVTRWRYLSHPSKLYVIIDYSLIWNQNTKTSIHCMYIYIYIYIYILVLGID